MVQQQGGEQVELSNYVTFPKQRIRGSRIKRNTAIKALWIKQLGARCVSCGVAWKRKLQLVRPQSGKHYFRWTSNLDIHYTGPDRANHVKFRLAKLEVPSAYSYVRQQWYLYKFRNGMCPCVLHCKRCHGEIHGIESGQQVHAAIFTSFETECMHRQYLIFRPPDLMTNLRRSAMEPLRCSYSSRPLPDRFISSKSSSMAVSSSAIFR